MSVAVTCARMNSERFEGWELKLRAKGARVVSGVSKHFGARDYVLRYKGETAIVVLYPYRGSIVTVPEVIAELLRETGMGLN